MALKAEQQKSELIDEIAAQVQNRLEPGRAEPAERFVRMFYAHVPPDDMLSEAPENLYGAAMALWSFAQTRVSDEAKIHIYNPKPEEHGWKSSHSVVEIVNDDMPFLVDSVTAALNELDAKVLLVIHPIIRVTRDKQGRLKDLKEEGRKTDGESAESFMHLQINEQPPEVLEEIRAKLAEVLADVRAAVTDWKTMMAQVRKVTADLKKSPPPLPEDELKEGIAFLEWLADDHFTFLGCREYYFEGKGAKAVARIDEDSGLGVLRDSDRTVFEGLRNLGKLPEDVRDFVRQPQLLRITKANRRSSVHRPVHMDTVAVKMVDAKGQVKGERLFLGLFTSVAYSRSPREIPLLREKVDRVMQRSGFRPDSHDGKALMHILENFPRDELFQSSDNELFDTAMGILHLQERQRIALFVRRDPFERFVSCLVYVPRDRHDTSLRLKFQDILAKAFDGEVVSFYTHMGDQALARLHMVVRTKPGKIPEIDHEGLEWRLRQAARSWADHLEEALIEDRGEEAGLRALRRFADGFPASYQDHFPAHGAVFDITKIEQALESGDLAMNLYRPLEATEAEVRLKIYNTGDPVPLSDILPMLENMDLKVIAEHPYDVWPRGLDHAVWVHDFVCRTASGLSVDLTQVKEAFHDAFARVWRGDMEDDGFNRLVLIAGLSAREITILRAYSKYLRQAAIPFSQAYMEQTLALNPGIARLLVRLFQTLFDPESEEPHKQAGKIVEEIQTALDEVANLDQDRIIRRFLNAMQSTMRTNFYQPAEDGGEKPYASFKFDSLQLEELPLPKPFREIFVYSPRVEGVHLRFGKVARGGLRWSDRREDFRTEILGLVKAQQVKNAVIVPVGSKGGFVLKRPPAPEEGREAMQEEGIACYKIFIRGLLDITDNLKEGEVVPPTQVVRRDESDPYLVVAADKGTATFSDIANGVSQDYGFWLDDAFASGGSAGYDHKKMGITARGAWESVKRHFREIGKDTQSEDFTCIGCGDMSGDVFGNGMLLSKHIKLIGAFNHMHIFVDPDPDPAKSWEERKRLFDLPRSAWTDYDSKLISKGGGVFDRRAKSVKVTPEMKKLFGIEDSEMTPNELIRAMLKSEAELLWFGGIGTYVKSSDESHLDAGDRGNDAIRIDAEELKVKVVGEGANLGMTQLARIEYALAGGRLNTDSIDNSAGVDCSDHEVNIKILLGEVEEAGDMTRKQRDKLLEKMTDEVARLVLRDNYLQTQAISVTHMLGAHLLDRMARFMRNLERQGKLSRHIEFLPDDEIILERRKAGIGMTRPELAVLLSYAKITLYEELLASDLPDDKHMFDDLVLYFPKPLREDYAKWIGKHRLKREIVATAVTNSIVNRVGITFVHELREKTGMPPEEISRAYAVSREVFAMRDTWLAIEGLDNKVAASAQYTMLAECGRLIEQGASWFLRMGGHPLDIAEQIDGYRDGVATLVDGLDKLIGDEDKAAVESRAASFREQGAPRALAWRVASLRVLAPALDIVRIASGAKLPVEEVGRLYFQLGARFGFDWLRRAAAGLSTDDAWDKLAVTAIVDDLFSHQGELTSRILGGVASAKGKKKKALDGELVDDWAEARRPLVNRADQLINELKASGAPDLAMLAVANRQLKTMVEG